ncbi:unnamed protein product [Protopolystoma xenopodis]|uniref:Uncharacterized protein n=1 Tax=Protopolystoma xenopodis TaxID=117903 RepID=A0A3S5AQN4_9PLAT|nr:unnamed protein product [Protopolystoma xenopodis]
MVPVRPAPENNLPTKVPTFTSTSFPIQDSPSIAVTTASSVFPAEVTTSSTKLLQLRLNKRPDDTSVESNDSLGWYSEQGPSIEQYNIEPQQHIPPVALHPSAPPPTGRCFLPQPHILGTTDEEGEAEEQETDLKMTEMGVTDIESGSQTRRPLDKLGSNTDTQSQAVSLDVGYNSFIATGTSLDSGVGGELLDPEELEPEEVKPESVDVLCHNSKMISVDRGLLAGGQRSRGKLQLSICSGDLVAQRRSNLDFAGTFGLETHDRPACILPHRPAEDDNYLGMLI